MLKVAEGVGRDVRGRGLEPVLYVVGKKGVGYFRFRGVPMRKSWQGFSEVPPYEEAERVGRVLIKDFADEEIDELHAAYTDFRSAFTLRARRSGSCRSRRRRSPGRASATSTPSTCSSPSRRRSWITCSRSTW